PPSLGYSILEEVDE
nr:hypothetical protein [Tanacetum cinerariifolium]